MYSFEVVGGVEPFASAVDVQCYKKGLIKFKVEDAPNRCVSYIFRDGVLAGLGKTAFVDVYFGDAPQLPCAVSMLSPSGHVSILKNLCGAKAESLQSMGRSFEQQCTQTVTRNVN